MGRPPLVDRAEILDVARAVACERGCAALAVSEVAQRLGRPSGSLYHRFPGRDSLLAELWLDAVEDFQAGYLRALGGPDPVQSARQAARHVLTWAAQEPQRAQVLLTFRRSDLLGDDWPPDVVSRAQAVGRALEDGLAAAALRVGVPVQRLRLAAVDVPYALVRRSLDGGAPADDEDVRALDAAVRALLRA